MIRKLVLTVVLAAATLAAACAPPPPPAAPAEPALNAPADIAALNASREAFMTAYEAGDAAAIGNLYTNDAISESNNQPSLKGRDAIVASLKGMFEQVSVKTVLTAEDTKTLGGVGVDTGRYAVIVTPKAGAVPSTNEGRYMVVYVKESDGQWRVWRDMDNAIGAPRPASEASPAAENAK